MELQTVEQLGGALATHLVDELVIGHGQLIRGVGGGPHGNVPLALVQHAHPVVLLSQIGQVEERRERADEHLGMLDIERVDERHGIAKRGNARRVALRDALLIGRLVGGRGAGVALVCHHDAAEQLVEERADGRIVFIEHPALQAQEELEVLP